MADFGLPQERFRAVVIASRTRNIPLPWGLMWSKLRSEVRDRLTMPVTSYRISCPAGLWYKLPDRQRLAWHISDAALRVPQNGLGRFYDIYFVHCCQNKLSINYANKASGKEYAKLIKISTNLSGSHHHHGSPPLAANWTYPCIWNQVHPVACSSTKTSYCASHIASLTQ